MFFTRITFFGQIGLKNLKCLVLAGIWYLDLFEYKSLNSDIHFTFFDGKYSSFEYFSFLNFKIVSRTKFGSWTNLYN